jgi:exosortase/archaeosortase
MKLILLVLCCVTLSILYLLVGLWIAYKYETNNAVASLIFAYFWPAIIVINMLRRLFMRGSNEKRE